MNTIHNLKKKLVALGSAAAATPALLLLGAGTAHADPYPKSLDNGHIRVDYTSNPLGLTATIQDHDNGPGTERCNYQTFSYQPIKYGAPTPVFSRDVSPNGTAAASLFIPGIQLDADPAKGPDWSVTVWCEHGGILSFNETY